MCLVSIQMRTYIYTYCERKEIKSGEEEEEEEEYVVEGENEEWV